MTLKRRGDVAVGPDAGDTIIEMLPGDLKRIAEVAGPEVAVRIARAFRGTFLYVPGLDEMMRKARDSMIRRDYDSGTRTGRLAIKYGLTNRHIRRILNSPTGEADDTFPSELLNLLYGPED